MIYGKWQTRISNWIALYRAKGIRALVGALRNDIARWRRSALEFQLRPHLLTPRLRHICGPREIRYAVDELLVISVVRNGEPYVNAFVKHYRALGIKHFVFLDNGSTDRTLEMLCATDNATVLQARVPYRKYENTMKRYLAERFSQGKWNLCADIDEHFDYPFSKELKLKDFLRYLNSNGYTAVAAQMLDMFSECPLVVLKGKVDENLKEANPYYDISNLEKTEYLWSKRSNPAIKMHWGGIRKTVFGSDNGLTKSPLVLMDGKVRPFITWHHVKGAKMADLSCVLMHYPFVGTFQYKVKDAVLTGRYGFKVSDEYRAYAETLERDPQVTLKLASAQRFKGLEPLIGQGFLVVSEKYRHWIKEQSLDRRKR